MTSTAMILSSTPLLDLAAAYSKIDNCGSCKGRPLGLGDIGPLGNASSVDEGFYDLTGTHVGFYRNLPKMYGPTAPERIGELNGGTPTDSNNFMELSDRVYASGVVSGAANSQGVYVNLANVQSDAFGDGWVAVQYLSPVDPNEIAASDAAAAAEKAAAIKQAAEDEAARHAKQPKYQPVIYKPSPAAVVTAPAMANKYAMPILIGAGVLGVGIIGWALLSKKKAPVRRS